MHCNVEPDHTPWGKPDHKKIFAQGIIFFSTPSHGGIWLDNKRNAKIPSVMRDREGWYEEDCCWAKVVFTFPDLFSEEQRHEATRVLKDWYPAEWEAVTGKVLQPGESYIKDQQRHYESHAGDWIVISAIKSDHHAGMVECIATVGGIRGEWHKPSPAERRFLVPDEEYSLRGRFGFVIDEGRHATYDGPSSFVAYR